ncbi:hypothetical protein E2562_023821 [Oryza meyeriana var. granulata]|uniref:Uncharacterized protein n=1 Tax=Oryza meyeriana var. granulata TaxID=110450 RepID=A0A6G1D5S9_9ORYZ|nr:hypothetical protein E2562_023821 [Oryza meyeriana var. granulata]
MSGVRDCYTNQELSMRRITTAMKLFEIVERCAWVDEAIQRNGEKGKVVKEAKPRRKDRANTSKKLEQLTTQK